MDRNRPALTDYVRRGWILAPLIFLGIFFFYPLIRIFVVSLMPDGVLDLSGFARLIAADYYRGILVFSLAQAALSTLITLGLALPAAYVFSQYEFRGKTLFLSLATLPFVLPTVVVAVAFTALIGPRGVINGWLMSWFNLEAPPIQLERTFAIILIVHVFYNFAVALRIIASYWSNQNPRIEQAAQILGAGRWALWRDIRLPILRPAIVAAGTLVFIFTFTSFGVILLLGGPRFATLEVEIYRQAVNLFNLPVAAALSLVQIGLMFGMMLVYTQLQRRISTEIVSAKLVAKKPRNLLERGMIALTLVLISLLLFTPLIALALSSLTLNVNGITLQYYQLLGVNERGSVLFVPPVDAIGTSLGFALMTTILAVVLGFISARMLLGTSRWVKLFDPLFMLPLATSAVTLGFGFIIALDRPPLDLRRSIILIPLAHTLVAMPFVIRSVLPALRAIPPSLKEASAVLGASPWQRWLWVELPLVRRALLVGATFAFTVSMGEFGASLFIARPDTATIPIVIFRLLGQPGVNNYGRALAMSTLLMLVSAISFVIIDRLRKSDAGEF
jgi:thiamine transport system permease protein